jgi:sec-independent protein translocase protein TatA
MFSGGHLLIVLIVVLIIFGAGKLPRVMGDVGKGIRSMREGLKGEDETPAAKPQPKDPAA